MHACIHTCTHYGITLFMFIPVAMGVIFDVFINGSGIHNEEDEEVVEFCVTIGSGTTTEVQIGFPVSVTFSGG